MNDRSTKRPIFLRSKPKGGEPAPVIVVQAESAEQRARAKWHLRFTAGFFVLTAFIYTEILLKNLDIVGKQRLIDERVEEIAAKDKILVIKEAEISARNSELEKLNLDVAQLKQVAILQEANGFLFGLFSSAPTKERLEIAYHHALCATHATAVEELSRRVVALPPEEQAMAISGLKQAFGDCPYFGSAETPEELVTEYIEFVLLVALPLHIERDLLGDWRRNLSLAGLPTESEQLVQARLEQMSEADFFNEPLFVQRPGAQPVTPGYVTAEGLRIVKAHRELSDFVAGKLYFSHPAEGLQPTAEAVQSASP